MSEMLEKILTDNNIKTAYKRVYANKSAGGADEITINKLEEYMQEQVRILISMQKLRLLLAKLRISNPIKLLKMLHGLI